jgi:hypothetical protein
VGLYAGDQPQGACFTIHLLCHSSWIGGVYNCRHVHATLAGTPAMAADLTDHCWSIDELFGNRSQLK